MSSVAPAEPSGSAVMPSIRFSGPEAWRLRSLAQAAETSFAEGRAPYLFIVRDRIALERAREALRFFAPRLPLRFFPAWDCRPYDRTAPSAEVLSERLACLAALRAGEPTGLVLTTVAAVMQRIPAPEWLDGRSLHLIPGAEPKFGEARGLAAVSSFLATNGHHRCESVTLPGEYAVRGGLLDLYPPGAERPVRLDFFGDALERIRPFDPMTQRSLGESESLALLPASETPLSADSVERFRLGWRKHFDGATADRVYQVVSEGGFELSWIHYLPLLHERLALLPEFLPGATTVLDVDTTGMARLRAEEIHRSEEARNDALTARARNRSEYGKEDELYRPLPSALLYAEWEEVLAAVSAHGEAPIAVSPDNPPSGGEGSPTPDLTQARSEGRLFPRLAELLGEFRAAKLRVLLVAVSEGSATHLENLFREHELGSLHSVESLEALSALPPDSLGIARLPLGFGFVGGGFAVLGEYDLLGERRVQRRQKRRSSAEFGEALASLNDILMHDLVVHEEYGIGRFEGLEQVRAGDAPHDCLRVSYHGGDCVLVPVESLDRLSRYGEDREGAVLDRLGRVNWQARKARVRDRLRQMAKALIAVAAVRAARTVSPMEIDSELYDTFCRGFPWAETPDQLHAIAEVESILASGRVMEHLVCGDAGFGKTEVALRASCIAASHGRQVAVIAPTTLLAGQHYRNFSERFEGLPFRVAQFSRLVPQKTLAENLLALKRGEVDIAVGTHLLFGPSVEFQDLGLLVVDEEQRLGVRQKERLKEIRQPIEKPKDIKNEPIEIKTNGSADTDDTDGDTDSDTDSDDDALEPEKKTESPHVLTLSATPIPRTLQLALGGVMGMSLISTPPPDRAAVRTFISAWDPVQVREALIREHARGGQSFVVAPRISDLEYLTADLPRLVPELRFSSLHGGCRPTELESVMAKFVAGEVDVLLSTDIIESGLDIPNANTLIVWRSDRFGLAQLYQLRGRVGRGREVGVAYFTVSPTAPLTPAATRRFDVLRRLDGLSVGFSIAAADLEHRGGGNLLGEEQSGHIREVGVELYQRLLEEEIVRARAGGRGDGSHARQGQHGKLQPQLSLGVPVLLPADYVPALALRLRLYRRLARLETDEELAEFLEELEDRFGPAPREVRNLVETIRLRGLARLASIEKVDVNSRGAKLSFSDQGFGNPVALVEWISSAPGEVQLHPDGVLEYRRQWPDAEQRLRGTARLLETMVSLAATKAATPAGSPAGTPAPRPRA